jgi:nucleoside-diphosphate-sugar epimerase
MKLLVTGTTGFIGKHLVKRLLDEKHELHAIVRPSTDTAALENITPYVFTDDVVALTDYMRTQQFDGVVHLASLFLAKHESTDVKNLIDSNVLFSTLLLEATAKSETRWFINTGTFWQHYESKPYSPVNLYAATKQAFQDISEYYLGVSTVNFVTIKLSDTFGPGDTRAKIFNLWAKISQSGEMLDMSPGEQIIDISYIDNVVDGFVRMIELLSRDDKREFAGKSFAVSSGQRMSLKELAAVFEKTTGKTLNINWGTKPYREREVMVPWETGEPIPGWTSKVSIEAGIAKVFHE